MLNHLSLSFCLFVLIISLSKRDAVNPSGLTASLLLYLRSEWIAVDDPMIVLIIKGLG